MISTCVVRQNVRRTLYLGRPIYSVHAHRYGILEVENGLQGPRKIDKWGGGGGGGAHIHIFVLCIINLFWNRLFLQCEHAYMNMCPPPPPELSIFRGP